ncbi:MAG: leucine-rich repeat domain-containing protein [Treponema sp.]|nr:leucine-rich repeat domain-containing protein [Treponema sp.]
MERAFESNELSSITLPTNITSIEERAFANNDLTSVIIPNSVTSIGEYAFSFNRLTSITIGANVELGYCSFGGDRSVDRVDFASTYYNDRVAGTYVRPDPNSFNWTTAEVAAARTQAAADAKAQIDAWEQVKKESGFTVGEFSDGTLVIIGYTVGVKDVIIPSEIGGKTVAYIETTFYDLNSVVIPPSIVVLQQNTFRGTPQRITIGSNVPMHYLAFDNYDSSTNFQTFYAKNKSRAGTYTSNERTRKWKWTK